MCHLGGGRVLWSLPTIVLLPPLEDLCELSEWLDGLSQHPYSGPEVNILGIAPFCLGVQP